MNFRNSDIRLINKMSELGLAIPAEDIYDYEFDREEKYIIFKSQFMTNKTDVLCRLKKIISSLKSKKKSDIENNGIKSNEFKSSLIELFTRLYDEIENSSLFDAPQGYGRYGYWHYVIEWNVNGVRLNLVESDGQITDDLTFIVDEDGDGYTLHSVDARLLSSNEYAEKHGVENGTIRQWIRRGKIRDAVRLGGEWMISELADIPNSSRGFQPALYSWERPFEMSVKGFENFSDYLSKYNYLSITKVEKKSDCKFEFRFVPDKNASNFKKPSNKPYSFVCKKEEAESIELLFISSAFVHNEKTINHVYEYK